MSFQVRISAGFVLLAALVVFFDDVGLVAACIPVIAVHELGHAAAMRCFGASAVRLNATASGFSLDYHGGISGMAEVTAALAGPAAGLALAFFCSWAGKALGSEYLLLCAGLGAIINFFNLLPCLPLDGGRALHGALSGCAGGDRLVSALSWVTAIAVTAAGLYFAAAGKGVALCAAGGWLIIMRRNGTCK